MQTAKDVDRLVLGSFWERPRDFVCSLLFNFAGWFGGVIEILICLPLLGLEPRWDQAVAIETFGHFVNNVAFFVPARLGVAEVGRTAVFAALGLPMPAGMAYAIIRRARECAWILAGYAILASYLPKMKYGQDAAGRVPVGAARS